MSCDGEVKQVTVGEATAEDWQAENEMMACEGCPHLDRAIAQERERRWRVVAKILTNEGWLGRSWQLIENGIRDT